MNTETKIIILAVATVVVAILFIVDDGPPLTELNHSIGVATPSGDVVVILKKGTPVPTQDFWTFSTSDDYQNEIWVDLVQGENDNAENNSPIGTYVIQNVDPELRGTEFIDSHFVVNEKGRLKIVAVNQEGKQQHPVCYIDEYEKIEGGVRFEKGNRCD